MKTKYTINKSSWPAGPWMNEPDQATWTDEATRLECAVLRMESSGHLCGYVKVPKGHPLYRKHYSQAVRKAAFFVHGSLTFSGTLRSDLPGWWFGFDCAHSGDFCPGRGLHVFGCPEAYKDFAFAVAECRELAAQLAAFTK